MSAPSRLSRRAALAAGAGTLLAVPGCGREAGTPPRPAADGDPDRALVEEVIEGITATAALSARVPELTAVHAAHLAALEAAPAIAGRTPLARLRRAEAGLQRLLVDASVRAESGALARLFASMSAAIAQQLAVFGKGTA